MSGPTWVERAVAGIVMAHDEWLEDVLAGLLVNGLGPDRVAVGRHPEFTSVTIDGIERYRWVWPNHERLSERASTRKV